MIINHVNDVIALSSEPPVQDFIGCESRTLLVQITATS